MHRVQFSIATPLQKAVADMLDEARQPYEGFPSYYAWLVAQYERKRCVEWRGLVAKAAESQLDSSS